MLNCKLVSQDSETCLGVVYETTKNNFGNEFSSLTLNVFAQQFVDLMLEHYEPSELIGDWISFSQNILECNINAVLSFLKTSANISQKRYSDVRSFLASLDENSLTNAIGNHTIYSIESYFLENLIEVIRKKDFSAIPSRLESELGFCSIQDAKDYMALTQFAYDDEGLSLYEIETTDCKHKLEADQNFLNKIELETPIHVAIGYIHGYWSGNSTENPLKEILLQGKLRLKGKLPL